jgi:phosphate transport system substrate-binding protein
MRLKTLVLGLAAALALVVPATASAKTLIGSGSVAMQPALLALFKGYKKVHPNISFVYTANGGNAGVKDVQNGTSQFAGQARLPLPSDTGTTYVRVFLDGLCVIVNPANKLDNITSQGLSDIYLGNTTNWTQVPGANLSATIDPVGRDTNGGTFNFFSQAVLGGKNPASNVNAVTSDGLVANAVKNDPNAIGYDGLFWAGRGTRSVKVNGFACETHNIRNQNYPLWRNLFIVLPTGSPDPDVTKFVDWVRTSPEAGTIISKVGGVPVYNKKSKK